KIVIRRHRTNARRHHTMTLPLVRCWISGPACACQPEGPSNYDSIAGRCIMCGYRRSVAVLLLVLGTCSILSADWRQFRGPQGLGTTDDKGLPLEWSDQKNVVWRTELPGPGGSSPVVVGGRVYVTCYTGYGENGPDSGKMADLRRHLVCVDCSKGK